MLLAWVLLAAAADPLQAYRVFRSVWEMPALPRVKSTHYNNSCILPRLALNKPDAPQRFLHHCCEWVLQTSDLVWHAPETLSHTSIEEYFYENFTSTRPGGEVISGIDAYHEFVGRERKAFPEDYRVHVNDCACVGNDLEGYKATLSTVITGTNNGPFFYRVASKSTPRSVTAKAPVRYASSSAFYIGRTEERWQYIAEWVTQDTLTKYLQLRIDMIDLPRPEETGVPLSECVARQPTFGWQVPPRPADAKPRAPYAPPSATRTATEGDDGNKAGGGGRSPEE
eukprot:TRINITY_DN1614_c0_g1_i1.p2 TRINITY_DN1614_c0_g1~~TRINITY_DN1614_c0_g1_i1.p2  ORF type:complete len:290 (-),score=79.40 TRINITY_DN1614_c0_g1_i1:159-1007(-)